MFKEESFDSIEENRKENDSAVLGKQLEGKSLIGISIKDSEKYIEYLDGKGISYEIYSYADNQKDGLLVLLSNEIKQEEIFDDLIKDNQTFTGWFWSHCTVNEEKELIKTHSNIKENHKEMLSISVGDKVRLTQKKIESLIENGYIDRLPSTSHQNEDGTIDEIPLTEGIVISIKGDIAIVRYGSTEKADEIFNLEKIQ